jgi:hypothetical protein
MLAIAWLLARQLAEEMKLKKIANPMAMALLEVCPL